MNLQPVSHERHQTRRWIRFPDYHFTASYSWAPLAAAEVTKAALALPLAFIERAGQWSLVGVLGLKPDQNLYVTPDGQWIGSYIPAVFRAFPFSMRRSETGEVILCVDEGSGLVLESGEGEPFFGEGGEPSDSIKQVLSFLSETAKSEAVLTQACGALHAQGVFEPWPITIDGDEGQQQVGGLYRINEAALNRLDDVSFNQLRRAGVVPLAYAQLLSIGNLTDLARLAQARAQAEAAERARAEVKPMVVLPDDNTIDWDWSKIGR
ncbi:SapC family protein [Methylobacterium sp. WL12]|uniref:SapC family protein n=1 Tax=Methylobacterium sp. WL12 TaxID=2603890 RepID=UPI0011C83992|nr:SapC family protein [Methylobacterium sp. WL12]TXM67544.1 SapC family protein [Methylobacterium sp. WL12]